MTNIYSVIIPLSYFQISTYFQTSHIKDKYWLRKIKIASRIKPFNFWSLYFGWETSIAFSFSTLFYGDCLTQWLRTLFLIYMDIHTPKTMSPKIMDVQYIEGYIVDTGCHNSKWRQQIANFKRFWDILYFVVIQLTWFPDIFRSSNSYSVISIQ